MPPTLIGGPVKFYHSKINFKLPHGGAEIGWHQDWPVFPHTNTNLVAISLPLNASRRSNGCLRTIPGTHRQGPRSHWDGGRYLLNCNAQTTPEEIARAVDSELDPGDIVAHHGLVVHGSAPNLSETLRTDLDHPVRRGRRLRLHRAGDRQHPSQPHGAWRAVALRPRRSRLDRIAARLLGRLLRDLHAAGRASGGLNARASRHPPLPPGQQRPHAY